MAVKEDTGAHRVIVRKTNGQLDAAIEEARAGLWSRMPDWLKVAVAVATFLGGGGSLGLSFIRPSVVEALGVVPVSTYKADMERVDKKLEGLEMQMDRNTEKVLDALRRGRR